MPGLKPSLAALVPPVLARAAIAGVVLLLAAACSAPIGTEKADFEKVYQQIHDNPVIVGEPSRETRSALHRFEQQDAFKKTPDAALARLRQEVVENRERGLVFALAELNYLVAERLREKDKPGRPSDPRDYYLAAASYAWLFLFDDFPGMDEPPPGPFDQRLRVACDLYNNSLGRAIAERHADEPRAVLASGTRALPGGTLNLALSRPGFPWPVDEFDHFAIADQLLVRGLSARNRQSGLGATLVAQSRTDAAAGLARAHPCTVLLRMESGLEDVRRGDLRASLELYSPYVQTTVEVGGRIVPLETDTTVPTAYVLNQSYVWDLGMLQFLSSEEKVPSDVYLMQPYRPGCIPVVFVHGTFSSPIWWAEMVNALAADPLLNRRYQFWYFIYNSGNPVFYSAAAIRESLQRRITALDPVGRDEALRDMVLVGHSQGGLLAKLTATNTGDAVLRAAANTGQIETLGLPAEQEAFIRKYTCFEALPFVKRVVFISTPHRGSYVANRFVRTISHKLVSLPSRLAQTTEELSGTTERLEFPQELSATPTSLDSMSPDNPALLALAEIPLAPGVKGHSIIAVRGKADPKNGKDGIVAYSSAHVDYVESEYIVRGSHSCQDKPPTIEEVLRILREHLREIDAAAAR